MAARIFSQEHKDNISKAKKGTMTGEKNPMFGKHRSQKTKGKISRSLSGENHPNFGKRGEECCMFGKKNPVLVRWNRRHSGKKHPKWKEKIQKTCPVCKIIFKVKPSLKNQKYCSSKCFGKVYSEERKGKYTGEKASMYGRVREKNPSWRGGVSFEPYTTEFNKQLKELIRLRDGYRCQKCGCPEIENRAKLTCHHIDYDKKNCLPRNLISLCKGCNSKVNKNRDKWTRYFQKKIAEQHQQNQLCLARL